MLCMLDDRFSTSDTTSLPWTLEAASLVELRDFSTPGLANSNMFVKKYMATRTTITIPTFIAKPILLDDK